MCSCNQAIVGNGLAWPALPDGFQPCSKKVKVCRRGHPCATAVKRVRQCLRPPEQAAATRTLSYGRWAHSAVFPLPMWADPAGCCWAFLHCCLTLLRTRAV